MAFIWNFVFDHEVSPLRHISDFGVRHTVFQMLGWMWAIAFSVAIGSYTVLAISLLGHAVLIGAAAITVATYTAAANGPNFLVSGADALTYSPKPLTSGFPPKMWCSASFVTSLTLAPVA